MKRREKVRPDQARVVPPAWVRHLRVGLLRVAGLPESSPVTVPVLLSNRGRLDEMRRAWCRENGCHRQGRTCVEVYGTRCDEKVPARVPRRDEE